MAKIIMSKILLWFLYAFNGSIVGYVEVTCIMSFGVCMHNHEWWWGVGFLLAGGIFRAAHEVVIEDIAVRKATGKR